MMPLLIGLMAKNRFDTHTHPGSNLPPLDASDTNGTGSGFGGMSAFLPLLLLQPGLLGVGGSRGSSSNNQDSISPLLMAFVLMQVLK